MRTVFNKSFLVLFLWVGLLADSSHAQTPYTANSIGYFRNAQFHPSGDLLYGWSDASVHAAVSFNGQYYDLHSQAGLPSVWTSRITGINYNNELIGIVDDTTTFFPISVSAGIYINPNQTVAPQIIPGPTACSTFLPEFISSTSPTVVAGLYNDPCTNSSGVALWTPNLGYSVPIDQLLGLPFNGYLLKGMTPQGNLLLDLIVPVGSVATPSTNMIGVEFDPFVGITRAFLPTGAFVNTEVQAGTASGYYLGVQQDGLGLSESVLWDSSGIAFSLPVPTSYFGTAYSFGIIRCAADSRYCATVLVSTTGATNTLDLVVWDLSQGPTNIAVQAIAGASTLPVGFRFSSVLDVTTNPSDISRARIVVEVEDSALNNIIYLVE